jgi:hypothetical protein
MIPIFGWWKAASDSWRGCNFRVRPGSPDWRTQPRNRLELPWVIVATVAIGLSLSMLTGPAQTVDVKAGVRVDAFSKMAPMQGLWGVALVLFGFVTVAIIKSIDERQYEIQETRRAAAAAARRASR